MKVLVTGSSGYVGSSVVLTSDERDCVLWHDRREGPTTSDIVGIYVIFYHQVFWSPRKSTL